MDVSGKILLFILILSGFSAPRCGATTYHSKRSAAKVQALQNAAQDGDTITLPAGAFIWTQGVTITKGITLQGQTTTDPVNRAANDRTIILDDLVRGPGGTPIIMVQSVLGKSYRLTGITFAPGSVATTNYNGAIKLLGTSQTVRVDDCHFNNLMYQAVNIMTAGSVYGVIDHNVLDFHGVSNNESVVFNNGGLNGDPAWANPGFYGSEKFMFVEDNCFNNTTNPFLEFAGCTDDTYGARWVFRYNHSYDAEIQTHGTECCRSRGGRAREVYNNDFHFSRTHGTIGIRSGGLITHDNTWDGAVPSQGGAAVQNYRSFFKFPGPWGGATGDNSWDYNATEPDGTHVDGHPPYVFLSGTATGGD